MQSYLFEYEANSVICREGDPSNDLYFLESGRLLVCLVHGTEVKALAKIGPGEFLGELSFFDSRPRSGNIISLERSKILQIPKKELIGFLPIWFTEIGKGLTKKIRLADHIIQENKIRRSGATENGPLSIEEQRLFFELLTK